jgi:hypothetical protein
MQDEAKLTGIKIVHTLVWLYFNGVIFYMLYAVLVNKLDKWLWIGFGVFMLEGITLLLFKLSFPLTLLARFNSTSTPDNFDIYLPDWRARHTKLIITTLLVLIALLTVYRHFNGAL